VADWAFRGDRLAAARDAANMTRSELAAAVHVASDFRIALWERGEERPQSRFIPLLAHELGVDPLELIDGDPRQPDLMHLRVAAGLSVREIAQRAGLTTMSYHRLERRGASAWGVSDATVDALARALEISPDRARELVESGRR
jgi:transcriptional regulator with XRE-family HTH domain